MRRSEKVIDPSVLAAAEERLTELATISEDRVGLTRTFLSGSMQRANALVEGWMEGLGMEHAQDRAGTLIGRLKAVEPTERVLLLGSHLDTVRNGGAYDGALGVVVAIAALEQLRCRGVRLGYKVDVIGFGDEEGVRFQTSFLSSRYLMGNLPREELDLTDADGISIGEAIGALSVEHPHPGYSPEEQILGYVECHIEQGTRLEELDLAVGVVSAIIGQTRARFRLVGNSAHAGAESMETRRDALAGAAELIVMVESLAVTRPGLVATVGWVDVKDAASNTIPGEVVCSLDVRSAEDSKREGFCRDFEEAARPLMEGRGLGFEFRTISETGTIWSSERLTAPLEAAVRRVQGDCAVLQSSAGHDAVAMSAAMGVAMLFVRCRDGLSHHPDEYASPDDIAVAIRVMADFLVALDGQLR